MIIWLHCVMSVHVYVCLFVLHIRVFFIYYFQQNADKCKVLKSCLRTVRNASATDYSYPPSLTSTTLCLACCLCSPCWSGPTKSGAGQVKIIVMVQKCLALCTSHLSIIQTLLYVWGLLAQSTFSLKSLLLYLHVHVCVWVNKAIDLIIFTCFMYS